MPDIGTGIGMRVNDAGSIKSDLWSSYWATLISATVENAAPTHVVLTFPTAQTSLGATDFTIAGFTISSASWTGAVLTLVVHRPVTFLDLSLTITFVKTGTTATVTNNVAGTNLTVTDNFQSYNTGDLAGQGNWLLLISGGQSFEVTDTSGDRRAALVSGVVGNRRSETFSNNQFCQARIDDGGSSYIGIGIRVSQGASAENGFYFYGGSDDSYVVYRVNGSETNLAGGSYPLNQNDLIRIEIDGTTLSVYRNGSLDTRHNGTGIYNVATAITNNPVLASGSIGIWGKYNGMAFDDFEGGDLSSTS